MVACTECGIQFTEKGLRVHVWRVHGEGKRHNPNSGYVKGSRKAWNKGLTKADDPRVAKTHKTSRRRTSADNVKAWRQRLKQRMVDLLGGACCICGYNKCISALEFHHVDPSTKSYSIAGLRSNPQAWDVILTELRKCALVCSNCHKEVEAGETILPGDYPRVNEELAYSPVA